MDMVGASKYADVALKLIGVPLHQVSTYRRTTLQKTAYTDTLPPFAATIFSTTIKSATTSGHAWCIDDVPSYRNADSVMKKLTIHDGRDVLPAFEELSAFCHYLIKKVPYQGYIEPSTKLARDLLAIVAAHQSMVEDMAQMTGLTDTMTHALQYFRASYAVVGILIHCKVMSNSEGMYDAFCRDFLEVLELNERLISFHSTQSQTFLPFTSLTVKNLWFIALHCRDPILRRRAIKALSAQTRNEAGYNSYIAAQIALQVVQLEEVGLIVTCMSDIPVSRRVSVSRFFKNKCGELHVLYVATSSMSEPLRMIDLALPSEIQTLSLALGDSFVETLNTLYTCFAQHDATLINPEWISVIFYQDSEIALSYDHR